MIYMRNYDTSRLVDVGDCFAMTGCWPEAAEVYFKGNKSFSMCLKGKLFNLGFQFLQRLWGEALSDVKLLCTLLTIHIKNNLDFPCWFLNIDAPY